MGFFEFVLFGVPSSSGWRGLMSLAKVGEFSGITVLLSSGFEHSSLVYTLLLTAIEMSIEVLLGRGLGE